MLFCWDYDEHGNVEHIAPNTDSQPTMWNTPLITQPRTSPADPAGDQPSMDCR